MRKLRLGSAQAHGQTVRDICNSLGKTGIKSEGWETARGRTLLCTGAGQKRELQIEMRQGHSVQSQLLRKSYGKNI